MAEYWHGVVKINDYQKNRFAKKIIDHFDGDLNGNRVAILGWAFKKDTNDSRESAAIYVASYLIEAGAHIAVYDPMVAPQRILSDLRLLWESRGLYEDEIQKRLGNLECLDDYKNAIQDSHAVGILTEWDEFKDYPWEIITKETLVIDGRNILDDEKIKAIGK